MKLVENVVSTAFLMTLPAEIFLNSAYREFFRRDTDESGRIAYEAWDFTEAATRSKLIAILSESPEFTTTNRLVAWAKDALPAITAERETTLRWHGGAPVPADWYSLPSDRALSTRYNPILLWVSERGILYSAPGMVIQGSLNGNVLSAPPEWVMWGPKAPLAKGQYKARCEISLASNDLVILDISSSAGTSVHRKIEFFGDLKVELPITLEKDVADLEVRLFNLTGRDIAICIKELSISSQ